MLDQGSVQVEIELNFGRFQCLNLSPGFRVPIGNDEFVNNDRGIH